MKSLHLLCNAHLDPVWQWEWQEGLAAALSTFRVAAAFCEEDDGFVFNHNEAVLYQWVEEYEPPLFRRIQKLVRDGKWHIMGGWYIQPDCNLPSGEAIIRQALVGRRYFHEKFGCDPHVAVNIDAFGHSRGIVQILQKAGYTGYLFMRPDGGTGWLDELPQRFTWKGYAGSQVTGYRLNTGYNTGFGHAAEAIEHFARSSMQERDTALRLWGVGDHGGGPSKKDLADIADLQERDRDITYIHTTPERYFHETKGEAAPDYDGSLNPVFVGCYTSMHEVKRSYRKLENAFFKAEKMAVLAENACGLPYPREKLAAVCEDMLFSQFHDILPGTCIQSAESASVGRMLHGIEEAERLINRSFFALAAGQPAAEENTIPILVYNPQPYPVSRYMECEFMLNDQNWADSYTVADAYQGGVQIPSQIVKEGSSINLDWRKRAGFFAVLPPMAMSRVDLRLRRVAERPPVIREIEDAYQLTAGRLEAAVDAKTGALTSLKLDGEEYARAGLGMLEVYEDTPDPWRMDTSRIDRLEGCFAPLTGERLEALLGTAYREDMLPVRIVEDGDALVRIEALCGYRGSNARVTYSFGKQKPVVGVDVDVYWNEKNRMLRLFVPSALENPVYYGQDMCGTKSLQADGAEMVVQKWTAAVSQTTGRTLAVCNDSSYGCMMDARGFHYSVLRSPVYTAHPIPGRELLPLARFYAHMDQGERHARFTLAPLDSFDEAAIDREAQLLCEEPVALSVFPSGDSAETAPAPGPVLEGARLDALKKAEDGNGCIIRLFNPSALPVKSLLRWSAMDIEEELAMEGYDMQSYRVCRSSLTPVDLLERCISAAPPGGAAHNAASRQG